MRVFKATARPGERGSDAWFTGTVWLDEIAHGAPPSRLRVHRVSFEPGALTAWHTHPLGQALHVLAGVGRVQRQGEALRKILAGDTVWIEPGEMHWHGAAPDRTFVHLAVQEASPAGDEATWFEHVTNEEYQHG